MANRPAFWLPILLVVAGCAPDAPPPAEEEAPAAEVAQPEPKSGAALNLDAEGLRIVDRVNGSSTLLAFGTPRASVEAAVVNAAGAIDDASSNAECGAGPMEFARVDALTLNYQDGKFVGWFVGDEDGAAAFATASGIGIGTTRSQAAESVEIVPEPDSNLGEEFRMGAGENVIGGIFAGQGDTSPIETLFAGVNCFFR